MPRLSPYALAFLAVLLVPASGSPPPARAAVNRTVNTLGDVNNPGDGLLTLREAIAASSEGDSIDFAVIGPISLLQGELLIGRALTINGPGARQLAIDAGRTSRIFNVQGSGAVAISGLTITQGDAPLPPPDMFGEGFAQGGAIFNRAPLTLSDCVVSRSAAIGPSAYAGFGEGGGIYSNGPLTLRRCLVSDNFARAGADSSGNKGGYGGGIYIGTGHGIANLDCSLTLVDTTVADNDASSSAGGALIADTQTAVAIGCTFTGNTATGINYPSPSGGILGGVDSGLTLRNTLVAGNKGGGGANDVSGRMSSQGFNFIGVDGGTLNDQGDPLSWKASDHVGTPSFPLDALLGPLRDNGGLSDTVAPLPGSGAIDAGDDSLPNSPFSITTDQRGLPRKLGPHVDIGAYETDVSQPGPSLVVNSLEDPGDGIAGQAQCTLHEAVSAANTANDSNLITFKPGLSGTIVLSSYGSALSVTNPLNLAGPGARVITVSSNGGRFGIFDIRSTGVSISGLTIRGGIFAGDDKPGTGDPAYAGGVRNSGGVTINWCAILNNTALAGSATSAVDGGSRGGAAFGGGLYNEGTMTLNGCTIAGNIAAGGNAVFGLSNPGAAYGGGVYSKPGATLTMTNCTVSGNRATARNGASPAPGGGGLLNAGAAALLNCTIASNTVDGSFGAAGGGLANLGSCRLRNTLIAFNTAPAGPDVYAGCTSDGNNLIGQTDGSSGWVASDRKGTAAAPLDPKLLPLANNGGGTDTRSLGAGSPANNTANATYAPVVDQRGYLRNGVPEIGACETAGALALAPTDETVTPGSGSSAPNEARAFTCRYRDSNGAYDIKAAYFLVNTSPSGAGALYCYFDGVNNKLYLRNNAGNAWLGGFAPGTAGSISDPAGRGRLNTAGTTVTRSGNWLTIEWWLVPNAGWGGAKSLYTSCLDKEGMADGWDLLGTWTINP